MVLILAPSVYSESKAAGGFFNLCVTPSVSHSLLRGLGHVLAYMCALESLCLLCNMLDISRVFYLKRKKRLLQTDGDFTAVVINMGD